MNVATAKQLGAIARTVRTKQGLTQPQLAGACGTGVRFIVDLEKGKPTCELEKALTVLSMLGITLQAHSPDLAATDGSGSM